MKFKRLTALLGNSAKTNEHNDLPRPRFPRSTKWPRAPHSVGLKELGIPTTFHHILAFPQSTETSVYQINLTQNQNAASYPSTSTLRKSIHIKLLRNVRNSEQLSGWGQMTRLNRSSSNINAINGHLSS